MTQPGKTSPKSKPAYTKQQSRTQDWPATSDDNGQLSIAECRVVLCQYGADYTEEETILIRRVLYSLADVDYNYHQKSAGKNSQEAIIIPFSPASPDITTYELKQQESHPLHPRIYRRAG